MISTRQNLVLTCWQALYQQGNPFELYYKSKGEKCVLKKGLKALEELTLMREKFVRQIPPSKKADIWGFSGSCSDDFSSRSSGRSQPGGGRNTAKTLSELVIHESKNSASSGLRLSSAIAPARQNQFNSS